MKPRTHAGPPRLAVSIMIATVWWFVVLIVILFAATDGNAQAPGSAFTRTPAPGNTTAPAAPAWTPHSAVGNQTLQAPQATPLQQANLPSDLARLKDDTIIIVGGKRTPAGEVKRGVLALDDNAIIIIGGTPVAAGSMKRDLRAAGAAAAPASATPPREARAQTAFGDTPAVGSVSRRPSPERVTTVTAPIDGAGIRTVQWSKLSAGRLQTGSTAVIEGRGFGASPGSASVDVLVNTANVPGFVRSDETLPASVDVTSWSDGRIQLVVTSAPSVFNSFQEHVRIRLVTSRGAQYQRTDP